MGQLWVAITRRVLTSRLCSIAIALLCIKIPRCAISGSLSVQGKRDTHRFLTAMGSNLSKRGEVYITGASNNKYSPPKYSNRTGTGSSLPLGVV